MKLSLHITFNTQLDYLLDVKGLREKRICMRE